ncbi:PfkB family carbohydrate kinase, partial [Staphylococcus aureus]|nr:PfkB family carbohydrate kinase [Staphylococcus aureus]
MKSSSREYKQINSQKKVLVIGSAVIDVILNVDSIPSSGSDEFAYSEKTIVGGCAYNVGDILSQFKANYDLMVPVGDGPNGTIIKNKLKKEGKTSLLNNILGDNGWTLCIVENNGERTFLTMPGVEMTWKKNWFKEIDLNKYDYIYVSGY